MSVVHDFKVQIYDRIVRVYDGSGNEVVSLNRSLLDSVSDEVIGALVRSWLNALSV